MCTKNEKIIAVHGGGDWYDASAEYFILPDGMDVKVEKKAYLEWYNGEYKTACEKYRMEMLQGTRTEAHPKYISFTEWLVNKGATVPTEDQLEIVDVD